VRRLAVVVLTALALAPAVAGAQRRDPADPGATLPDRAPPPVERPGARGIPQYVDPAVRFTSRDREQFKAWAVAEYGKGKCPRGLVKRDGGCLPRGVARKRYTIGLPLPATVVPAPLPLDLARRVGTPPIGYRYGLIDGDLVKIELASALAVDALDGFIPK